MHPKTLTTLIILITILILQTHQQYICSNCISLTNMTSNFTCNNMSCQGFIIPYDNQYNFNASAVMCNQANGARGGSNCFYQFNITNSTVTYFFCNASIIGCASCSSQTLCMTCYNGYYLYKNGSTTNCQICSNSLPGCLYCDNQGTCTQCYPGYVLLKNLCANINDKTLPLGIGLFTYEKGGSTVAEIIGAVLIFCILIMVVIAVVVFFCKEKKQIPDFLNPAISQNSIQQTFPF